MHRRKLQLRLAAAALGLLLAFPCGARETTRLTLNQAQEQARRGNQGLKAAREEVTRSRAVRLQTWAGHLPSIGVSEQVVRSNDAVSVFGLKLRQERFAATDFAIAALNEPEAVTGYQTALEVRQPIYNGGQAFAGRAQATAGVHGAEARLVRAEQEVRLRTAEAYWGLVLSGEALKAVRQGLQTVRAHAAAARARYEQQTVPLTDLLAAQVRVSELRNEEIAAANRVAEAADGLTLVLGLPSHIEVVPVDSLAPAPLGDAGTEPADSGLETRADLVAMAHQVEGARNGVRVARAPRLPHLNAFARINLDADQAFARQGESWTVGAVVSWDLFGGFRNIGGVRQARAQVAAAEAQAALLRARAEREVRQARRQVRAAQVQIDVAQEAVDQASERLRISELQYREGVMSAPDLLDAETRLTQSRIRRLQAVHALHVGRARLEFATAPHMVRGDSP